jgi:hypothetical protein
VRTSIVAWSAASGAVIGAIAALLLVGAGAIAAAVLPLPAGVAREIGRRGVQLSIALLVLFTAVGAVLGYLEGRLKVR